MGIFLLNFTYKFLQASSKKFCAHLTSSNNDFNSSVDYNSMVKNNDEKAKYNIKRKSIKHKCKYLKNIPSRRSSRNSSRKNYTEEEVPDDDHYICTYFTSSRRFSTFLLKFTL